MSSREEKSKKENKKDKKENKKDKKENKKRHLDEEEEEDYIEETVDDMVDAEDDVEVKGLKKKKRKVEAKNKGGEDDNDDDDDDDDDVDDVVEGGRGIEEATKIGGGSTMEVSTSISSSSSSTTLFSNEMFKDLPISDATKTALEVLGFKNMTHIQSKAIPHCLAGTDVIGAAKTGSGKTLSFLVPIVELLQKVKFTRKLGAGAIVISPTRELALQIYGVLRDIMDQTGYTQTHGLIMGGANRRAEADKLVKGVNIIVATPGRLVDHLMNTQAFLFTKLLMLVVDEADRILEQGFEEDMHQIIKILPKERQTILFSATQTKKVEDLARLSIQGSPVYVGVHDDSAKATVDGLQQGYVLCPAEKRFLLLYTFLKKNKNKKIMVFFSSCNSVKFHAELLNYIDMEVMDIHGKQKQQKRTTTFFQFCKQDKGILLCTDVAARGLDIPAVDWIVQFDPPDDPKEYIHRVGRTARGTNASGRALLFLLPEETVFLKYLRNAKVELQEFEFPSSKVANIGPQLTMLIEKNFYLNKSAKDAYRSYLMSYASHSHKDIFNVHSLDLQGVGKAFGFTVPPRVDLNFSARGDKRKNEKKDFHNKSGHAFSAENPYGKRDPTDKRQFMK